MKVPSVIAAVLALSVGTICFAGESALEVIQKKRDQLNETISKEVSRNRKLYATEYESASGHVEVRDQLNEAIELLETKEEFDQLEASVAVDYARKKIARTGETIALARSLPPGDISITVLVNAMLMSSQRENPSTIDLLERIGEAVEISGMSDLEVFKYKIAQLNVTIWLASFLELENRSEAVDAILKDAQRAKDNLELYVRAMKFEVKINDDVDRLMANYSGPWDVSIITTITDIPLPPVKPRDISSN